MVVSLWEPDVLTSQRYGSVFRGPGWELPEKRLLAAVLTHAVADFHDALRSPRQWEERDIEELKRWFFVRNTRWPFSFENVCAHLNLDPDCIRANLKTLTGQPPSVLSQK